MVTFAHIVAVLQQSNAALRVIFFNFTDCKEYIFLPLSLYKRIAMHINSSLKKFVSIAMLLLCVFTTKAQFIATYPLKSGGTNPPVGTTLASGTSANVNASAVTVGTQIASTPAGSYNGSGLRMKLNSGVNTWPNSPTDEYNLDVTISPKANYDFTLDSISYIVNAVNSSEALFAVPMYQVDGVGAWHSITGATAQSTNTKITVHFAPLNEGFYNTHTYKFRLFFFGTATTKGQDVRINTLIFYGKTITPPAVKPSVHANSAAPTSTYTGIAKGNFDTGAGYQLATQAGFIYSTNTVPTFANSSVVYASSVTSPLNEMISGLTPQTTYYIRAFIITQADTIISTEIVALTTYNYSVPLLNTSPPTNVLSNKATTGGIWIDSGGYGVVEKGVLFDATTSNLVYPAVLPTRATSDGVGNADYTSILKNLTPNTKYYIMAYARNQLGAGYGNLDSFITGPPAPVISATPNVLDFGDITFNNTTPILSYKLNANYLTPVAGTVTINVSPTTQGYSICGTLNGVYGTSLTVPYVNGTITNKIIYVKSASTPYGNLQAAILHSGGGTVTPNADTVFLTTNVVQNPDTLSNAGTDFWCGNGYQERNDRKAGDAAEGKLSIYIAAGSQPAIVNIELPGISGAVGFPKNNINIPANSIVEIKDFPTGDAGDNLNPNGLPDARLYYTGISRRGIHIYSSNGTPVSVWMHTYANNNTAAGAMIFPTNTWNSSYTVQAYGGQKGAVAYNGGFSNNSNPNSYFFAIANDNNTPVWFTPSQDVLDSSTGSSGSIFTDGHTAALVKYKKGITYGPFTLNKGEVFNAMGYIEGSGSSANGLDLTGSKVWTTCDKKIAVFGGNGRCLVNASNCNASSGSDHMIQQMFPRVAWGTKYISVPTKTMEYNVYRITVDDPTTKVWVNNPTHTTPLTGLINNLFYQINSFQSLLIESDKPINVTQFITAGGCANSNGAKGNGDPEMIILSPVQQAITKATVYSAPIKKTSATYNGHYINVVIKKAGVASFRLDGLATADTGRNQTTATATTCYDAGGTISIVNAFVKHPYDTSYYWAKFKVAPSASHTLKSDYPFNAIAYGMGDGESYGYNAGTTINNLSAVKFSLNPYGSDTASGSVKTCVNNLVTLQIALPYDTSTVTSIIWDPGADATSYSPTGPQPGTINPSTTKPLCIGTIVKDGRTFYIYKSPAQYTFLQEGAYKVKVTVNGTFSSDCGGLDNEYINVIVGHDDISFTAIPGACGTTKVTITDASTPLAGTTLLKWIWDFGDGTLPLDTVVAGSAAAPNPHINPHNYPANTSYTVKLTTINSVGCFTTDSVTVSLAYNISTSFTQSQDTICPNASVVFTPTSSAAAAKWFWDFGDGSATAIDSSNAAPNPVSHQYVTEGKYIVKHFVKTAAGCPSAIVQDTVVVVHQPVANFVLPSGVCLPGNTLFTNTSDTANLSNPTGVPYSYHWSFGTGVPADTSDVKNPVFAYSSAPGAGGYAVSLTATNRFGCVSTVKTQNVTTVYNKPTALIANTSDKKACVGSNASFFDASSGTGQTVNSWYWNFGDNTTSTQQNPQHIYSTNTFYTVKLVIGTDKGCVSDTAIWSIKVNPKPVAGTILPSSCITSGSLFFQDNSTVAVDDSTQTPYTYTWNFGDGTGTFTTKDSSHTYAGVGTYYINHSITTLNGCTDTKTDTFSISGSKPVPGFSIGNASGLCSNGDVTLTDTSRVAIGTVKKVEIRWDAANNYVAVQTDNSPANGAAGSSKNYVHKYPSLPTTQTYVVRLYAYSGTTCMDSIEQTITVYGSPKVIFDTLKGVCLNASPRYIHLAHDSSGVFNNAALTNYYYSGTAVVADTFYPAVAGVGTYLIKAVFETVTPASHCRDSATSPIKVWALPNVSFITSSPLCEKSSVTFTDHSTAGAGTGNVSSWSWNFGNAGSGTNTSTLQNPTHNYAAYNTYTVNLTATSDSGCSATATPVTITIHPKPVVGFIVPAGVCSGTPVGFTDTSKIADNSESQFTHYWNFGDNTSATGTPLPNTSHLYAGSPTDSVRLIVTSKDGCKDSLVVKLSSVVFPQQNPVFSANGRTINGSNDTIRTCVGNAILFANQNTPTVNQGYWEFGDTAALVNPGKSVSHIYPAATVYIGKHYADDSHGCRTTTAIFNVLIWALPTPIIKVGNPTCEKNNITFTDGSTTAAGSGDIKVWSWHFGDPTSLGLDSASTQIATHNYATTGSYNVNLTVTSDSGCMASTPVATVVNVHSLPAVKFGLPAAVCLPLAAQFSDSSTIADGSEAQFTHSWDFGDIASGSKDTVSGTPLPNPTHIFTVSNNYTIKLTVTSKDGCVGAASNVLSASAIHNQPKANYSVNPLNHDTPRVCIGTPIFFKDSSGGNTAKSYWIWGDNGFALDSSKIINHIYPAGTYIGEHFINDNFGCRSDTISFLAMIDTFPVVNDGIKYILAGTSDILKPDVSGGNTYLWTTIVPFGSTKTYLDLNDIENPICTPLIDSIVYKVDVTADGVCPAKSLYYTVRTFTQPVIPNVFSPNGDGVNDYWDISSLKYFAGANVQVFDRYGRIVLSRLGYSRPWDGNDANGKPLPVGTYYYVIQLGYGFEPRSGSITILR